MSIVGRSDGVNSIETISIMIIAYLRLDLRKLTLTIPSFTKMNMTIGIKNAIPNATII